MKTPAALYKSGGYHIALAREAYTGAENLTKPCAVETRVFGELSKKKLETESRRVSIYRGEFRPRQTRQLPRAVDLKGRLLSCQSH